MVLNEISLRYAPLMMASNQLFLWGFTRLIAELDNLILVSFLNNSTEVNLVSFSLIDDCKSLFHSFRCKKIIHMFREANQSTEFVVFSSSPLGCLSCRVLTITLVLCILGDQFLYDYWNETNKDSTKENSCTKLLIRTRSVFYEDDY